MNGFLYLLYILSYMGPGEKLFIFVVYFCLTWGRVKSFLYLLCIFVLHGAG